MIDKPNTSVGALSGATPTFAAPNDVTTLEFDLIASNGVNQSAPDRVPPHRDVGGGGQQDAVVHHGRGPLPGLAVVLGHQRGGEWLQSDGHQEN